MDVKFAALKTICDILLSRKGSSCSLLECYVLCMVLWGFDCRLLFYVTMLHFLPFIESNKKPITNHQHCRAKLRARCLCSSLRVPPIDGNVITVARSVHIMAASDSHHPGPVSYLSCKRGWRGMPPPLLCPQISRTWNQARNSQVLNVESPAKRRQAKRN